MRVVNRRLKVVEFQHAATCYGDEIVRWNTDPEHAIVSAQTVPLHIVLILDEWSIIARQNLPEGVTL